MAPSASPSSGGAWLAAHVVAESGQIITGDHIAHGSAGYLALGSRWVGGEGGPRPVERYAWSSPDGRTWEEVPFLSDSAHTFVQALAVARNGAYVAYISTADGESATLTSADGTAWTEVASGLPNDIYVQAVERGPNGWLLVGAQTGGNDPTLWLSDDGLTWERVWAFDQSQRYVQIHDADGGQEGYVVIGRRIDREGIAYERFALASADGREWFETTAPFGPDDQGFVFEVTLGSFGPDWIAVHGQANGAPAEVWFSANGLDWSQRGTLDVAGATTAGTLLETGLGLVFVPRSYGLDQGPTDTAWLTADGTSWEPILLEPGRSAAAAFAGIAESPGNVAIIGSVPTGDLEIETVIWVRSTE